jgi:ribonuclease P protein component
MVRKESRIKKQTDFERVFKEGKVVATRDLVLIYLPRSKAGNRLGISISKKFGKATKRNRAKRLIREAFRLNSQRIIGDNDIVVVVKRTMEGKSFQEVEKAFLNALQRANLLYDDKKISNQGD